MVVLGEPPGRRPGPVPSGPRRTQTGAVPGRRHRARSAGGAYLAYETYEAYGMYEEGGAQQ